jgi:hypothetical protein
MRSIVRPAKRGRGFFAARAGQAFDGTRSELEQIQLAGSRREHESSAIGLDVERNVCVLNAARRQCERSDNDE